MIFIPMVGIAENVERTFFAVKRTIYWTVFIGSKVVYIYVS